MAVERWDSLKWGSWRADKFKISRRKYRLKTEQIIRFSFHHYLFPPLKRDTFCPNGAHYRWQTCDAPSHSTIHCPGIVCFLRQLCWKDCRESLQTKNYLQNPKDNFSFHKKCLFGNYLKWNGVFLHVYISQFVIPGRDYQRKDRLEIYLENMHPWNSCSDELLNMTVGWTEIWIVLQQLCILVMKYWGEVRSEYSCWEINSQR